jgi:hypothetical protein
LSGYYRNKLPLNYQAEYTAIWPKKDYKHAAFYVFSNFREGDAIFHICRSSFFPFMYYHREELPEYGIILKGVCKKDWVKIFARAGIRNFTRPQRPSIITVNGKEDLSAYKRIWLIYSSWELEGMVSQGQYEEVGHTIINWLDQEFLREDLKKFGGIDVYLYGNS